MEISWNRYQRIVRPFILFVLIFLFAAEVSRSVIVAFFCSFFTITLYQLSSTRREIKGKSRFLKATPEIIDSVITGIQSGLSLTEALINLRDRGPDVSRQFFSRFAENIQAGISFDEAVKELQVQFGNRASDQLFEALILSQSLGGIELLSVLRQLGAFTRQELALRDEIEAKQSWIRNSAHISAAAPWILLLLLSAQPSTSQSYSTASGALVLAGGAMTTAIAYLWMSKLSRMPEPKRVFGKRI